MTAGPESRLTKKILTALRERWPSGWFQKVPGGAMKSGLPDLMGSRPVHLDCPRCHYHIGYFGLAVFPEIKSPDTSHKVTPLQWRNLILASLSGALASPVWSVREATLLIDTESNDYVKFDFEVSYEDIGCTRHELKTWSSVSPWKAEHKHGHLTITPNYEYRDANPCPE